MIDILINKAAFEKDDKPIFFKFSSHYKTAFYGKTLTASLIKFGATTEMINNCSFIAETTLMCYAKKESETTDATYISYTIRLNNLPTP